jgi:tetratricopeptide (TPR) repeat protein
VRSQARRRQQDDGLPPERVALGGNAGISNAALARMLARAPDATAEKPASAAGPEQAAREWFDRAQLAYIAKNYLQAAEYFRQAFAIQPKKPECIYNEGVALEMGRHFPAAANAYEHYLFLVPEAPEAEHLIRKIKVWRRAAADPDALMDPEETPAQAPEVTATGDKGADEFNERGTLAAKLGDYARAYEYFVRSYELKPDPEVVRSQGACLDQLGNREAAIQAFERYLALRPNAPDAAAVRKRIARLREDDFKPW